METRLQKTEARRQPAETLACAASNQHVSWVSQLHVITSELSPKHKHRTCTTRHMHTATRRPPCNQCVKAIGVRCTHALLDTRRHNGQAEWQMTMRTSQQPTLRIRCFLMHSASKISPSDAIAKNDKARTAQLQGHSYETRRGTAKIQQFYMSRELCMPVLCTVGLCTVCTARSTK